MNRTKNFTFPIRVYYEDTDAGGVVYHANYLKFFERARTEMLRALGYEHDVLKTHAGIIFVVRSLQIDYLRPALFNELLQVRSDIIETKKASFTFSQQINRGDESLCKGVVRIACLDAHTLRPKAIPDYLLELLSA
jgi:acyl-CoA thioester hydrolase